MLVPMFKIIFTQFILKRQWKRCFLICYWIFSLVSRYITVYYAALNKANAHILTLMKGSVASWF